MSRVADWLERRWYGPGDAEAWLRGLGKAYECGVRLRRWAYQRQIFEADRIPVPVVVVGNLSVGGTGKTPVTIWLVEFLRDAGYRPGVVSRGYGGRVRHDGPVAVAGDSDPWLVGDEPVLIAARTGAPVRVDRDRARAARALISDVSCDLIIADDGLQHYRLHRDIEILLIDGQRRLGNGHCLPAGPLREPPERIASVDFVLRRDAEPEPGEYGLEVDGDVARNLVTGELRSLAVFAGQSALAIAGIGNPDGFFRLLARHGIAAENCAFPDHHAFSAADVAGPGYEIVLMTEKDAVKCRRYADQRHWCVPVTARLPPEFGAALLQRLGSLDHG